MATRITEISNIVRQEAIQFIRAQNVILKVRNARPNTKVYVFFDEVEVTHLCAGGTSTNPLTTDDDGTITITFALPAGTFTVGRKQIIVADTNDLSLVNIPGTVNGSARGFFASTGRIDFYQTTRTETVDRIIEDLIYVPPAPPLDPPQVTAPSFDYSQQYEPYVPIQTQSPQPEEKPVTVTIATSRIVHHLKERGISVTADQLAALPNTRLVTQPGGANTLLMARVGTLGLPVGSILTQASGIDRNTDLNRLFVDLPAGTDRRLSGIVDYFEEQFRECKTQDPLAQSFFTYGIRGGFFLSAVELFFRTKDSSIPIRVEVRPLVNGYPSDLPTGNPNLVSSLPATSVVTSTDASAGTVFRFSPPIYLNEDTDYCFVVLTNSNQYNMFTSRMGEESIENGRIIFEQPFIGSLFKSENNITWTAEQFEDIKFNMYRAKFDTSQSGVIDLVTDVPQVSAFGTQFYTVEGSDVITYYHNQEHGLEVGSKFACAGLEGATYNGIPATALTGEFDVIAVPDRNTIKFKTKLEALATSTGKIESAGVITKVDVDRGGINYGPDTTISFSSGNAEATPIILNGRIVGVTITNQGSGYTSAPQVVVNSTTGSGAVLVAMTDAMFTVSTNKPMTEFTPNIKILNYGDTFTRNTFQSTLGNYDGGNITTYGVGREVEFSEKQGLVVLEQNSLIASRFNEFSKMSNTDSGKITIQLNSSNDYLSPMIDLRQMPELWAYSTIINDQVDETLDATEGSASISSFVVTAGGSDYSVAPVVKIIGNGTGATATAVINAGVVTGITVNNGGSGFTQVPLVVIERAPDDITGTGAAAQARLTPFNSELLPTGGNAKSRYLTRRIELATISTGIRLFSVINSGVGASVDWYIRTSLSGSGVEHEAQNWKRLNCNVSRDRSSDVEFYEYQFYLDNIPEFDTYDLKCVMLAQDPLRAPIVKSFRVIIVA
jgi:hypothetical protein